MKTNVIIALEKNDAKSFDQIAQELQSSGLEIEKTYNFGVIKGKIDLELIHFLAENKSVQSISREKTIHLPPNENEIQ